MQMNDILAPIVERPAKVFINDQLIGEINTDYQLNRIRLLVAKQELHNVHFLFDDENGVTHRIDCHPTGHLNHWPKGFFDFTQNQLYELCSLNRSALYAPKASETKIKDNSGIVKIFEDDLFYLRDDCASNIFIDDNTRFSLFFKNPLHRVVVYNGSKEWALEQFKQEYQARLAEAQAF